MATRSQVARDIRVSLRQNGIEPSVKFYKRAIEILEEAQQDCTDFHEVAEELADYWFELTEEIRASKSSV